MTPPDWKTATLAVTCPKCKLLWLRTVSWADRASSTDRSACCGKKLRGYPEQVAVVGVRGLERH